MMDIPNLFVASRQAFVSIDREMEVMDFPEPPERTTDDPLRRITGVKATDAGFTYDGSGGLTGLNFHLRAPEIVAVVGEVGSGKTTLLKMLAGLLPPEEGEITVNGVDSRRMDISRAAGYVPQDSVLLGESVDENVKFGRDFVSCQDIEEALAWRA